MAKEPVSDEPWEAIEPLLPKEPPRHKGGRPRAPDRAALAGIVLVLKTAYPPGGCSPRGGAAGPGEHVPAAPARLARGAGVWRRLHPASCCSIGRPDRPVQGVPGLGERARKEGGERVGKNPTDRAKPGSKRHLVSDRGGVVPPAVVLASADVHDSRALEELVDAVEPIIRHPGGGRPRKRPQKPHADTRATTSPAAARRSASAA